MVDTRDDRLQIQWLMAYNIAKMARDYEICLAKEQWHEGKIDWWTMRKKIAESKRKYKKRVNS